MLNLATFRKIGAVWGYTGVLLILVVAIYRLTSFSLVIFDHTLSALQWVFLIGWAGYMVYAEGIKVFTRLYSPQAVELCRGIARNGTIRQIVLAPLYCLSYFDAPKRRMIISYSLTTGIILFIILVRLLPQPWRAIIDIGAALGLSYGAVAYVIIGLRGWRGVK